MKNILYLGPYKDSNGMGYASRRYIDCLSINTNINLSIRPIFYTKSHIVNPLELNRYDQYEQNSSYSYDVVIQHGNPDMLEYNGRFGKNIGIVEIDTNNIERSGWIDKLNLMDEICVGSTNALDSLYNSSLFKTVAKILPEPYDLDKYSETYDPFFQYEASNKPFIFYTIGQYGEQKNIKGIVLAYLLEFNPNDNVKLFIKTGDYHMNNEDLESHIGFDIQQIKNAIRKTSDRCCDIDMIYGILKDQDIIRLHHGASCYVNAVRADNFGSCAIEAMLSNKLIINTRGVGSSTYLNSNNALMVDSIPTSVYNPTSINTNSHTIYEQWCEPDIVSLRAKMRQAYFMSQEDKQKLLNNYHKDVFNRNKITENIV